MMKLPQEERKKVKDINRHHVDDKSIKRGHDGVNNIGSNERSI